MEARADPPTQGARAARRRRPTDRIPLEVGHGKPPEGAWVPPPEAPLPKPPARWILRAGPTGAPTQGCPSPSAPPGHRLSDDPYLGPTEPDPDQRSSLDGLPEDEGRSPKMGTDDGHRRQASKVSTEEPGRARPQGCARAVAADQSPLKRVQGPGRRPPSAARRAEFAVRSYSNSSSSVLPGRVEISVRRMSSQALRRSRLVLLAVPPSSEKRN